MYAGEYNEHCHQNEHADRCSLDDDNSTENYNNCSEDYNNCSEDYNNCSEEYSSECQNQYRDNEYSNQYYSNDGHHQQMAMNYTETAPAAKGPELIYKSTKELYKAVARECGITCKMTDTCRLVYCYTINFHFYTSFFVILNLYFFFCCVG